MATLRSSPRPRASGLSPAERAELCGRVNFPALLRSFGVDVPNRKPLVCALRSERTPSCHLYAPNEGLLGARGWTWRDYGTGEGGDALGYLIDFRRLEFMEAVRLLAEETGFIPECLRDAPADNRPRPRVVPSPAPILAPQVPAMAPEEQAEACKVFLSALEELNPCADVEGNTYLRKLRGLDLQGFPPVAYHLPEDIAEPLAQALRNSPHVELMTRAGLMKPAEDGKPVRPQWGAWAGDVVLLAHHNAAGQTMAFLARRVKHQAGDPVDKYLQQTFSRGAVRLPFGLPMLYRPSWFQWKPARDTAGTIILCEGAIDALGAATLGIAALGLGMRLQARSYKDEHGAAPRMLDAHLDALSDCARVYVLPDNDSEPEKSAEGARLASRLVAYLRAAGCRAELVGLGELCERLELPPAEGCKDLCDLANKAKDL